MPSPGRTAAAVAATLIACAWPRPGRAHGVADTFTVGNTQTPGLPASPWVADKLSGSWDARDWLTLRLDGTYTYYLPAPPPPSSKFGTSAGNIFLFNLGADFLPNDHFTVSIDGSVSPASTIVLDTPYTSSSTMAGRQPATVDAQGRVTTTSGGGLLGLTYDTAGDSNAETAVDFTLGANAYATQHDTLAVVNAQGTPLTAEELAADLKNCTTPMNGRRPCSSAAISALKAAANIAGGTTSSSFTQFLVGAAVVETLFRDIDVGVSGNYYAYAGDPTSGFSATTGIGHTAVGFGGATPLAPFWWTVRPEITFRLAGFSVGGSFQYGQYVPNADYVEDLTIGLRFQYKRRFSAARLKVWLQAYGQRDVDNTGAATFGGSLAVGAKVSF